MKKLRVICDGGLGNQLFIWAFAHAVTKEKSLPVQVTFIAGKKSRKDRQVEIGSLLNYCNHPISISNSIFYKYLLKTRDHKFFRPPAISRLFDQIFGILTLDNSDEWPDVSNIKAKIIRGYLQNSENVEKYVPLFISEIQNQIDMAYGQLCINNNFKSGPRVHIRRGDYKEIMDSYGLVDLNYYKENTRIDDNLTIFTDDQSDLENLQSFFPFSKILGPLEATTWQAFAALAKANSLLIANSTFSYWAGILCSHNGGKVLSPWPWFRDEKIRPRGLKYNGFTYAQSKFE